MQSCDSIDVYCAVRAFRFPAWKSNQSFKMETRIARLHTQRLTTKCFQLCHKTLMFLFSFWRSKESNGDAWSASAHTQRGHANRNKSKETNTPLHMKQIRDSLPAVVLDKQQTVKQQVRASPKAWRQKDLLDRLQRVGKLKWNKNEHWASPCTWTTEY